MAGHWSDRDYAGDRRRKKGEPRDNERAETVSTQPGTEERAILIGVGSVAPPTDHNLPMLDELAELARTAGARIVGRLYQRRDRPEPASYLGRGKVEELKELCREADANVVIADDDLAPSQVRHLEEWLDLRVIDRSELIIHIFAVHARTRQARLQVELAQAKYMAPRLKRMWTHLSRITGAGGIGSRGPGEKQIEVDRRIIQRRIADLTAELREIEGRRERQVGAREDVFKSALVGYTNAGKSTIMRRLTGADVLVADQLFATLDTRTRRWQLADVDILLSDTVGFIEKLPHHLVASFHATLEEVREADLLIHIVDAGDTEAEKKVKIVRSVLENIGANEIPELLVLNKIDLLPDPMEATILAGTMQTSLLVSAVTGQGFDLLEQTVHDRATSTFHTLDLRVPVRDGRTLALVRRVGRIVSERYEGDQCHVTASVPAASLGALRAFIQH